MCALRAHERPCQRGYTALVLFPPARVGIACAGLFLFQRRAAWRAALSSSFMARRSRRLRSRRLRSRRLRSRRLRWLVTSLPSASSSFSQHRRCSSAPSHMTVRSLSLSLSRSHIAVRSPSLSFSHCHARSFLLLASLGPFSRPRPPSPAAAQRSLSSPLLSSPLALSLSRARSLSLSLALSPSPNFQRTCGTKKLARYNRFSKWRA